MPLFKKKPFDLIKPPEDLKPKDLVLQVRFTKEIFKNYNDYIKRITLYQQRVWTCKVTGKSNLTYEEALNSERKGIEQVQQFPKEFIGPVLNTVQFSQLRFKQLVSTILQAYRERFMVGEELSCVQGNCASPCKVLRVITDETCVDNKLRNYEIGWLDSNKTVIRTSVELADKLMRKKPPFTRALLMSFIRESVKESAMRNAPWVVHEQLCEKYGIRTDPPEELKKFFLKQDQSMKQLKPGKPVSTDEIGSDGHLLGVNSEGHMGASMSLHLENGAVTKSEADSEGDALSKNANSEGEVQKKQKKSGMDLEGHVRKKQKNNGDVGLEENGLKKEKKSNGGSDPHGVKNKKKGLSEGLVPKKPKNNKANENAQTGNSSENKDGVEPECSVPKKRKKAKNKESMEGTEDMKPENHVPKKPKKKNKESVKGDTGSEKADDKDSEGNMLKKEKKSKSKESVEEGNGLEGNKTEKVAPVKVKYPIDDSLVEPCADDPSFTLRPVPLSEFSLPMDCIGRLLMVWNFCVLFGKAIRLSPFSLEELEKALGKEEEDSVLLKEVHHALLNLVLDDSDSQLSGDENKPHKSRASIKSWKDELSDFVKLEGLEGLASHALAIRKGKYRQLEPLVKLEILCELVDRVLISAPVRDQLEQNIEEKQAIAAEKRKQEVEESKRVKEEHLKQAQTMANGVGDRMEGLNQAQATGTGVGDSSEGSRQIQTIASGFDDFTGGLKQAQVIASAVGDSTNGLKQDQGMAGGVVEPPEVSARVHPEDEENLKPDNDVGRATFVSDMDSDGVTNGIQDDGTVEGDGGTSATKRSRQLALRHKAALKEAEEREKEKRKMEEQQKLLEKKKVRDEVKKERELQERKMLEQQKRQEQFERELEKRIIRTSPLGRDRDYNKYWFFHREGRVFVEDKESTSWGYYSAKEELDALYGSLNPKGVRERALQRQLEKYSSKISYALQKRTKEIALRISSEEGSVRRSSRGKLVTPQAARAAVYRNKFR